MTIKSGFTMIEVTVAILIMGLSVGALLQMFDWSNMKYKQISEGWLERATLSDIRMWLRSMVINSHTDLINIDNLAKSIKLPKRFKINDLKLKCYNGDTFFVSLSYFNDANNNGKSDFAKIASKVFCFRKRDV